MSCLRHVFSAVGVLSFLLASVSQAQEEMASNPYHKFWSASKAGATAVHLERTKLSGPEGKLLSDAVDEKRIAYKLVEANKERAVVEMVVTERDILGYVQAAPTRYIYPAKVRKLQLDRILPEATTKGEDETVKVGDKDIKCKTVTGKAKGLDGEDIEFKLWLSDEVPGAIVKQVRTSRKKDVPIAETTTTLLSFKSAN